MDKIKICMLGAFNAGKSSLVERYVGGGFEPSRKRSLGVRIDKKIVSDVSDESPIELVIWDMTGTNKYLQIQTSYLKNASGFLLVVDQLSAQNVAAGIKLHRTVEQVTGPLPFVVAANKSDQMQEEIQQSTAWSNLTDQAVATVQTSAITGNGVNDAFTALVGAILKETETT